MDIRQYFAAKPPAPAQGKPKGTTAKGKAAAAPVRGRSSPRKAAGTPTGSPRRAAASAPKASEAAAAADAVPSEPPHRDEETPPQSERARDDGDGDGDEGDGDLSEYEKARLANIRANQERLKELGLAKGGAASLVLPTAADAGGKDKAPTRAKAKRAAKVPLPPERRSKRNRGEKPDYTGEKIDQFGDDLDAAAARRDRAPKASPRSLDEIVGEAREMLEKSRASLGATVCKTEGLEAAGNAEKDGWFKRAVDVWGPRVADANPPSWEAYVLSRVSHPPPPSPYMLLQEVFAPDVWKLLVSCVLMSRVSSVETKTRCIGAFFERCPTPSAALDADPSDILPLIAPLGLFENRMRAVIAITERFLSMPEFVVGLDKDVKIYGVGEFGVDSYLIFTKHPAGCDMTPGDRNLRAYCMWLKSTGGVGDADSKSSVKSEVKSAAPRVKAEGD